MDIGLLCAIVVVMCASWCPRRNVDLRYVQRSENEVKLKKGKIHPRNENTVTRIHDIP